LPSSPIQIPYLYQPRTYQLPLLKALDSGIKRAVCVWHRRSGKDKTFIQVVAKKAFERKGTYFYLFPTYSQAKKVIWDGMDATGFPFMGHFPSDLIESKNESELRVELVGGSAVQLIGTDNINAIMGTNPLGCVFSEFALQDPKAWDYMRPILRENGGWAIFNMTPRGKNHGYQLFQMAQGNPDWFCQRLTIEDTGVLTEEDMHRERQEGMSEEMIQQEYYVSFAGVMQGSVYGQQLELAEREGRVCGVPWEPNLPVDTWWDIGTSDATAIWFTQDVGREVHIIDYLEDSGTGKGIDHYVRVLQSKPYVWGVHHGPHDIEAHQFAANGKSTREQASALGFHFHRDTLKSDGNASIRAARSFMNKCWFDRVKTERGRSCLQSYHYPWDEKRSCYGDDPYHDWSSHGSKAFEYLGIGHKGSPVKAQAPKIEIMTYEPESQAVSWLGT